MNNTTCHIFSVDDAVKFGVDKAILLYNIKFWLQKELANSYGDSSKSKIEKHIDGKDYVWTYNSSEAFVDLFPYMTRRSISRYLQELEDCGELISGNFNKFKYDKTKWYTMKNFCIDEITNLANRLAKMANGVDKMANRLTENGQPIPYVNTNVNTDINILSDTVSDEPVSHIQTLKPLAIGRKNKATKVAKEKSPEDVLMDKRIAKHLGFFNEMNPAVGFVNKTYRSAIKTLAELYTDDQITGMIEKSFEYNGRDYAPVITNPYELLNKLEKLKIYIRKLR